MISLEKSNKKRKIITIFALAVISVVCLFMYALSGNSYFTVQASSNNDLKIISYYSFDDDTATDVIGGNNGVLKNNPTFTNGKYGKAIQLSETDNGYSYIELQTEKMDIEGDFAYAFWIKSDVPADNGNKRIISTGVWGSSTPGLVLGLNYNSGGWINFIQGTGSSSGDPSFYWGNTPNSKYAFEPSAINGVWKHVIVQVDATNKKINIYVNNEKICHLGQGNDELLTDFAFPTNGDATPSWSITAIGGHLDINSSKTFEAYTGLIDEFYVIKGMLSENQRTRIMNNSLNLTVNFNSMGGSCSVESATYAFGSKINPLPQPTFENKMFAGWSKSETQIDLWDAENDVVSDDITLYAVWGNAVNTVSFVTGYDVPENDILVNFGETFDLPNITRTDYLFDNWYYESTFETVFDPQTPIYRDTVLYAKWNKAFLDVTFDLDGGSAITAQKVAFKGKATRPANDPVKADSTFVGYYKDADFYEEFDFNSQITVDTVIYVKFASNVNIITFETNGGSSIASVEVLLGNKLARPANPTKTGYEFVNWYTKSDFSEVYDFSSNVERSMTLYAKWNQIKYTVKFRTDGGTSLSSVSVKHGECVEIPECTKEGYTLEGWYTDSAKENKFDVNTPITSNLTLYAKWTEIPKGCFGSIDFSSVATLIFVASTCAVLTVIKKRKNSNEK